MPYIDTNGTSAYYDITGAGDPVIFLHGGFCSAEVMRELSQHLDGYAVHAPERPGHGRTPDRPGPYHYDDGVADTLAFMAGLGLSSAHLVGFSDGANIGMLLALAHPERVRSLVHISGNLWPGDDVYRPEAEQQSAMPDSAAELVSREYDRLSPDGPGHAEVVLDRIRQLWDTEPQIDPERLRALHLPVLVMAGDGDLIARDHTELIHRSLPRSRMVIVPSASHMLVREQPAVIAAVVQEFIDGMA